MNNIRYVLPDQLGVLRVRSLRVAHHKRCLVLRINAKPTSYRSFSMSLAMASGLIVGA